MSESNSLAHEHVFLGADHANSERRTWWVIALCGAMMLLEIVGGWLFGSLALVASHSSRSDVSISSEISLPASVMRSWKRTRCGLV